MRELAIYFGLAFLFAGCGAMSASKWWVGAGLGFFVGLCAVRAGHSIATKMRGF